MRKLLFFLGALLAATNVYAIDDASFESCAAMQEDTARLLCFDNLAKANGYTRNQSQDSSVDGVGDWIVDVEVNPIDDTTTVTLILEATSGTSVYGDPVYFFARCMSGETDVFISWDDYLGREANVLTRVGEEEATTQKWGMSTDQTATFHPKPVAFLKDMMSTDRLVAQVTPYNESPVTAIFQISGLSQALEPLREECEW